MKRLFDFVVACVGLLIFSPLMLILAAFVRVKLGPPVLFKQLRPGLRGNPFYIYKFRTMTYEKNGNDELLPDAVRLTPFGKLLRRFSLDELPQFINVLKGDLSLVGPRPLLMEYLPLYNPHQARRHEVKPGITGWAQVNGRNAITWDDKFDMDVWYVDNRSFWLDIKIMYLTLLKMIRSEDISQPGHATMEEFKGSLSENENKQK